MRHEAPRLLVMVVALGAQACDKDPGGPSELAASRICALGEFHLIDRNVDLRLGPDLDGTLRVTIRPVSESLFTWDGVSDGVRALRRGADPNYAGPGSWLAIVPEGWYQGIWRTAGDTVRWSFDDDRPGVPWISYGSWLSRSDQLVAEWGDSTIQGWQLSASFHCVD